MSVALSFFYSSKTVNDDGPEAVFLNYTEILTVIRDKKVFRRFLSIKLTE